MTDHDAEGTFVNMTVISSQRAAQAREADALGLASLRPETITVNAEQWSAFTALIDRKPRYCARLAALLAAPSMWVETTVVGHGGTESGDPPD